MWLPRHRCIEFQLACHVSSSEPVAFKNCLPAQKAGANSGRNETLVSCKGFADTEVVAQVLAAFLKAIGFIIPLMDAMYANYYTKEVMIVLIREFQSPDEEMKKIVLKVVKQCVGTEGVERDYIRAEILPEFFRNFWVRRMAMDRRNYRQLVETTVELANKVSNRTQLYSYSPPAKLEQALQHCSSDFPCFLFQRF